MSLINTDPHDSVRSSFCPGKHHASHGGEGVEASFVVDASEAADAPYEYPFPLAGAAGNRVWFQEIEGTQAGYIDGANRQL